jgi:hypothetical protein
MRTQTAVGVLLLLLLIVVAGAFNVAGVLR